MTFVLKELEALNLEFNNAVDVYLRTEKKATIEELPHPRKYQLQYLSANLAQLNAQVRQKEQSVIPPSVAYYGIMFTTLVDINNTRGLTTLLGDSLEDIIGIGSKDKKEDRPNLHQIAKFHTAANRFLNQIFIRNDSRNGLADAHMLSALPADNLKTLIEISYRQEWETKKKLIQQLATDGKSLVKIEAYAAQQKDKTPPETAITQSIEWLKLGADLKNLNNDELADKRVSNITKLKNDRPAQYSFMNKIHEVLDASELHDKEKVAILAGAMHIVRQQAITANKKAYIGKIEEKVIYKGLTQILGADDVSPQDVEALVASTLQFLRFMTIESQADEKKAIRHEHIFSHIPKFDIKATLNLAMDMIYFCRIASLNRCIDEFKNQHQPVKQGPNHFANALNSFLLFRSSKSKDDEAVTLEHKEAAVPDTGPN